MRERAHLRNFRGGNWRDGREPCLTEGIKKKIFKKKGVFIDVKSYREAKKLCKYYLSTKFQ
jgi:hypothetical protein